MLVKGTDREASREGEMGRAGERGGLIFLKLALFCYILGKKML